jgi:hypothetical protein
MDDRLKRLNLYQGQQVPWFVPWSSTESDRPTEPPEGRPRFALPAWPER